MTAPTLAICLIAAASAPATAKPVERRLHSDNIDASSFLWNDWNKFVENYHPNYVADDDPLTAWVEGAESSGAGEWLRVQVTPLDQTTRVRLRVRNGYQKSKDLWRANARAKAVTIRLLPSKTEKKVTLTDTDGWQEVVIDQPSGSLRAVELAVGTVYEGAKYNDLCISDLQVFATSETSDNPAFEKSKRANLMSWRSSRIAASKVFSGRKVELPIYPAYEVAHGVWAKDGGNIARAAMIEAAQKDSVLGKEWKDALAVAASLEANLDAMTGAQLAPATSAKLVEVDGLQLPVLSMIASGEGPYLEARALRLPMLGTVAAMFADQLRVLDVNKVGAISKFDSDTDKCAKPQSSWVSRVQPKEGGPARVQAIAIGQCEKLEGRGGAYIGHTIELMIYDPSGRLVLVVGDGHIDGYRWTMDGGKPMLAGGRGLLYEGTFVEAKKRSAVAKK